MTPQTVRSAFRPEVQALRAIAVTGVVLYHLWPSAVPGGFVGVDVFFVISGFLITGQLTAEVATRGRVSLTGFWARRIRRILPAAFTVLLACIALVVLAMPRVTWATNLADVRAAVWYVENWQLGQHAVNYLAASHSPTVVQHYWSLSVEEQFYLCWPLLVLVAAWPARRGSGRGRLRWVKLVLAVAGVASFVTSVLWTARDPAMAFFATPTRAWEFAAGGLIGFAVPWVERHAPVARSAASWLGLVVVGVSMFEISGSHAFPGAIAAVPVIGAVLVIAAPVDSSRRWSPGPGFQLRPVQWLGDHSYSLYLWHWPIIVAAPWVLDRRLDGVDKAAILVLALALSAATTSLVEDPVRRGSFWRTRRWPAYGLAVIGVAAVAMLSLRFTTDVEHGQHAEQAASNRQTVALVARPHHRSCFGAAAMIPSNHCTSPFAAADGPGDPCLQPVDAAGATFCTFGHTHHPRQVVAVIGNSHAWRLVPALALYAQRHDWEIIEAARINCLGLTTTPTGPDGASPSCLEWSAAVEQHLLATPHLTAVLFAGYRYWQEFTAGPNPTAAQVAATRRQILGMWGRYDARGVRVLVTQDVPGMRPTLDPTCLAQSRTRDDPCAVKRSDVVRPTLPATLAQRHPGLATYLPLDQYFCDATMCHALIGGVVVYFDAHHMTTTFSRSLAPYLGAEVASALRARRVGPAAAG